MADKSDLCQANKNCSSGRNDRAGKLPRLAQRNQVSSGDAWGVSWWAWLLSIWVGVLLISLVLLAGFALVDWMHHRSPDADMNPDSLGKRPGLHIDGTVG
jgi:hypothetical protein